ncbi:reverse transcriptase domain-containing protein [Tanacetum coccineum]
MADEDDEKTAFHTSHGVYCYTKMPFGLKDARATYQRLVDKAFKKQIGRNLEVYVDDLVIKSHTEQEILRDIEETFRTLRKINMKLNTKKCTFGAKEGMEAVSAFLLTERESQQRPIYFVSRTLQAPEVNYSLMEKLVLTLVHASRRPRTSIWGQVLANFIAEKPEKDDLDIEMHTGEIIPDPWTLFTDESSSLEGTDGRTELRSKGRLPTGSKLDQRILCGKRAKHYTIPGKSKGADQQLQEILHRTVEVLKEKSIEEKEIMAIVEEEGYIGPPEEISSPKDIETPIESPIPVSPSSSVGSSSSVRSTTPPPDYPFDKSIFAELDNSLWIIPRPLRSKPVPEEPNESNACESIISRNMIIENNHSCHHGLLNKIKNSEKQQKGRTTIRSVSFTAF